MAPDLLSTICREIDERLSELRPLLAEHERLLVAADVLVATTPDNSTLTTNATTPAKRSRREKRVGTVHRGSVAGTIELAASGPIEVEIDGKANNNFGTRLEGADVKRAGTPQRSATKAKPERAARGAAREAILAALDHGSHTVGELAMVTAMSGPNISGNVRKLVSEGAVVKTEREGKAAWTLADVTS